MPSAKESGSQLLGKANESSPRSFLKPRKASAKSAISKLRELRTELRRLRDWNEATLADLNAISDQLADIRRCNSRIAQENARTQLLVDQFLLSLS